MFRITSYGRGVAVLDGSVAEQILSGVEATVPSVQCSLLEGDRTMHVEALWWLNCIFAGRQQAKWHQLCELGGAKMQNA